MTAMTTDTPKETMQELERVQEYIKNLEKYRCRLLRRLKWQQEFEAYEASIGIDRELLDYLFKTDELMQKPVTEYMKDFINETEEHEGKWVIHL